ncbi:hypothetical protein JX265_004596 [Neoarthrinium moseri]|uniref:Zn(2)-C6 fungal-type domain-containing protein n=1 Tax=Neoarthrinium moseri TaxID=1658444 RepID=A0A9P9WQ68_9PEZI|nr:hypothetical protein JX265_004596 [Neoarthrinium moseri]
MAKSRTGCLTCRKRKRKCDETRPECKACVSRNAKCGGYLRPVRWANGIASRGRFVGVNPGMMIPQPEMPIASAESAQTNIDLSSLGRMRPITKKERLAFDRFLAGGLHHICSARIYGWLAPFFDVMSRDSESIIVVAAALQTFLEDGLTVASLEHIDRALQVFRTELTTRGDKRGTATLLQAQPFTPYLRLITDVHNLGTLLENSISDSKLNPPVQHTLEVLGVMDLPTFVIGRTQPSMNLWTQIRGVTVADASPLMGEVEIVTGVPRSLLDIFARITQDDDMLAESQLWTWQGLVGNFLECHHWDSWRYAGILDIRRRRRLRGAPITHSNAIIPTNYPVSGTFPPTEVVLCRLLCSLEAMCRGLEAAEDKRQTSLHHGLLYPFATASLEFSTLSLHPTWQELMNNIRLRFLEISPTKFSSSLLELLDEARSSGDEKFDIEEAARGRNIEIALF